MTIVDPGRSFAFCSEPFGGTVVWRYEFAPEGEGSLVTESYNVTKPIGRVGWFIIGPLFRHNDRRTDLHTGMTRTLERLRQVAERESTSPSGATTPPRS